MWLTLKARLLDAQISIIALGLLAADIRARLADMPHRELARHLSGAVCNTAKSRLAKNMVVDTPRY